MGLCSNTIIKLTFYLRGHGVAGGSVCGGWVCEGNQLLVWYQGLKVGRICIPPRDYQRIKRCRIMTYSRGRNMHAHSFRQMYNAVRPGSDFYKSMCDCVRTSLIQAATVCNKLMRKETPSNVALHACADLSPLGSFNDMNDKEAVTFHQCCPMCKVLQQPQSSCRG